MRDNIRKRVMFSVPASKGSHNSGIMAGFDDGMMEDVGDEMPPMARTPQNPEILMNNLRGDMRSVDARYMELAQMVGEDAAMDTPPEVLAMLQGQMGAQQAAPQGGIGALPQGADMMPPPMQQDPMQQDPMQQDPMQQDPMAQMPPEGMPPMEGAQGPFMGGSEAPPTPDGLPPLRASAGAFATGAGRLGRWWDEAVPRVNQFLGDQFMIPQMGGQRVMGNGRPLVEHGRNTMVQMPDGSWTSGTGTRFSPAFEPAVFNPTFTQGLGLGARQSPLLAPVVRGLEAARPYAPATALGVGAIGYGANRNSPQNVQSQWPAMIPGGAEMGAPDGAPPGEEGELITGEDGPSPGEEGQPPADEGTGGSASQKDFAQFLTGAGAPTVGTTGTRIRERMAEYAPLFTELYGDGKDNMKTNALLLLADAGFKLAQSTKPTLGMALGEALSGMPKGFAGLVAQARQDGLKIKSAALEMAVDDIQSQDKAARERQIEVLKGQMRLMLAEYNNQSGGRVEDGGMGARVALNKNGSLVGTTLDPNDPTVQSIIGSGHGLNRTDNAYVTYIGPSNVAVVMDKAGRLKLGESLGQTDSILAMIDGARNTVMGAYSPGTWVSDKVNNLLVPIVPGLTPNTDVAASVVQLTTAFNQISKLAASQPGRVAVQQQEWERANIAALKDPEAFLKNPELAAKTLTALEAMYRNERHLIVQQLGLSGDNLRMSTPNTGTKSDPFTIPADPDGARRMYVTLGPIARNHPAGIFHLRFPDGNVQPVTGAALVEALKPKASTPKGK